MDIFQAFAFASSNKSSLVSVTLARTKKFSDWFFFKIRIELSQSLKCQVQLEFCWLEYQKTVADRVIVVVEKLLWKQRELISAQLHSISIKEGDALELCISCRYPRPNYAACGQRCLTCIRSKTFILEHLLVDRVKSHFIIQPKICGIYFCCMKSAQNKCMMMVESFSYRIVMTQGLLYFTCTTFLTQRCDQSFKLLCNFLLSRIVGYCQAKINDIKCKRFRSKIFHPNESWISSFNMK